MIVFHNIAESRTIKTYKNKTWSEMKIQIPLTDLNFKTRIKFPDFVPT